MQIDCFTLSMNQSAFLIEAVDSILNQSLKVNYIVYDAGSTDGSRELLENHRTSEFTRIYVKGDLGPSDGLNYGLQNAKGDVFYYLNADDRLLPGALAFVTKYFAENPECDILHGSINLIDSSGEIIKVLPSMKFSLKGYALGYSVVYQQATFIRRRILDNVQFNVENKISWDGEMIVDLAMKGARIHCTKKVLGEFRIYNTSISGSRNYKYLAKQQHRIISYKILDRKPTRYEIVIASCIRISRGILRRVYPMIEYLN